MHSACFLLLFLAAWRSASRGAYVLSSPQPTPSDDDVNRVAKQMYLPGV